MGYCIDRSIVFVGMMGVGKTAVGRAVAGRLGVRFADSDNELERASGMTIPEIFSERGEQVFRDLETRVIESLLMGEPIVLSVGGGAFVSDANRRNIMQRGFSVWIDADPDTIWDRVQRKGGRPLLEVDDPYSELKQLYRMRRPIYAKADVSVRSRNDRSVDDMAAAVVRMLVETVGSGVSLGRDNERIHQVDRKTCVPPE
ncbi:MAG: shikimate kinase [Rhodobacteraceae bacterium]|nr:shikimate kinase [Paracoccaceae bacterium]MCY4138023.1 shikimate kinase [Paracoccaceae bacterium]